MADILKSVNMITNLLMWFMNNIIWMGLLIGGIWLAWKIIGKAREVVEEEKLNEEVEDETEDNLQL